MEKDVELVLVGVKRKQSRMLPKLPLRNLNFNQYIQLLSIVWVSRLFFLDLELFFKNLFCKLGL